MSSFTEISVIVDGEAAEAVAEMLRPFAYQDSVVLEQKGDAQSLDPMAVVPEITVKIYVPEAEDAPGLRNRIEEILYHMNRLYPIPAPQFRVLQEEDWANAWKDNYHPFRVGEQIWIMPSWYDEAESLSGERADANAIILVMDPGMAFGTGLHPTTQTCLIALERTVQSGDLVLDVGTGTGILAIAAVKLGAASVIAVDTDEQAVKASKENARLNEVAKSITTWQGDLSSVSERSWNVVTVNILAPVIINLLAAHDLLTYVAPEGRLILSGIIDTQMAEVEEAVVNAGGHTARVIQRGDWVTLIVERGSASS